jgi:hypothetical protein
MRTPARRSKAALAAWSAGWSVHAVHALRGALWPNLVEICGTTDSQDGYPRQSGQCPVCSQFLAAAPPGLLGFAEHEAIVPRAVARSAHASLESADARAPPTAA